MDRDKHEWGEEFIFHLLGEYIAVSINLATVGAAVGKSGGGPPPQNATAFANGQGRRTAFWSAPAFGSLGGEVAGCVNVIVNC